jgi:hypothetical protein
MTERRLRESVLRVAAARRLKASGNGGMTLVETLLGLAITGMVGAAIAAMLAAVSTGTADVSDGRRTVIQHKVLDARIGDAIRYSRMVLASYTSGGSSYLVLWMNDSRSNTSPNLSEIRVIEHNPATRVIRSFKAATPAGGWTDANDTKFAFDRDFSTIGVVSGPGEIWATDVSAAQWTFGRGVGSLQTARLVSYRFTIGQGPTSAVVVGAAAMRNTQ